MRAPLRGDGTLRGSAAASLRAHADRAALSEALLSAHAMHSVELHAHAHAHAHAMHSVELVQGAGEAQGEGLCALLARCLR